MIDGRHLDLGHLVDQDEHRQQLQRFLWTVLLADGTRALIRSGHWEQALRHLDHHHGIGQRLLDGRQVAILARAAEGDFEAAIHLLDHSHTPEPWEQAVAACLRTLCLRADGRPSCPVVAETVDLYLQLEPLPGHLVFRTRLGLCLLDLIGEPNAAGQSEVATRLVTEAVASGDGYVAWDVLTHPSGHLGLTEVAKDALRKTIEAAGLHRGSMPAQLLDELITSTTTSEIRLAQSLGHLSRSRPSASPVA